MEPSNRREVLRSAGVLAAGFAMGGLPREGITAEPGTLPAADEIVHLLGRITYGVRPEELETARRLGYEGTVEWQLDHEALDDSAVEAEIASAAPTLAMPFADLLALQQVDGERGKPIADLHFATLYRAVYSPRQLHEKMVEFWSDHFNVNGLDGVLRSLKPWEDRQVMRPHALGRFRDLLGANAASPAMQVYLDNASNTKDGPNENYARELLELHTLGVDGGYTQEDVAEAARVLTGWAFSRTDGSFLFRPARHDYGAKAVLGTPFPAGRGIEEGDDLLDLVARHESTATFLAAKLARRFVADDPPASLVEAVARSFRQSDGDIRSTVRTLLLSAEFRAARDAKTRRPFDLVVALLRALNPVISESGWRSLGENLRRLGQLPFTWPAPDGFPDVAPFWVSSTALLNRFNLALVLAGGTQRRLFAWDLEPLLGGAVTPETIVDALTSRILARPIADADRATLVAFAAEGRSPSATLSGAARERAAREALGLLLCSRYVQNH
ncbi:MAG: DUF1800 domain-containing protein [Acidobacteriota bacterium]